MSSCSGDSNSGDSSVLSNNDRLLNIIIDNGTLDPAFNSNNRLPLYEADVTNSVDTLGVSFVKGHDSQAVDVKKREIDSNTFINEFFNIATNQKVNIPARPQTTDATR